MDHVDLQAAQQLTSRIRALAVRDEHRSLLEIAADPDTSRLLDLLGTDLAAAARLHLDAAGRWKVRMEETNRRRLDEAQAALDGFDLTLSRAVLSRIEEDWLTPNDAAVRDGILLQMEARTMETEELTALASEAFKEHKPIGRRWQRRRKR
ncbi:MAG: hypothetical protein OEM81_07435 [Acidimicrobiia bacterium]|nr:hypothetical protein [Acidimicrobiia bacterium]MDH3397647.1 hypothetical protein [Acidimicrobiia bacterium]